MFNERKVAQMAAFFINKEGGSLSILKLMKLLYLSDRESMNRYHEPISYDNMVSMPHGPVLSMTLNHISEASEPNEEGWAGWVSDRANHQVSLTRNTFNIDDLDEMSEADLGVLEGTWREFGAMDQWEIRDYTHDNCPEWRDPDGSAFPIEYSEVFKALGKNEEDAAMLHDALTNQRAIFEKVAAI